MPKIEARVAALEEAQKGAMPPGTPEQCCAAFGYSQDQARAEYGGFPEFCYAKLQDASADPGLSGAHEMDAVMDAYHDLCNSSAGRAA